MFARQVPLRNCAEIHSQLDWRLRTMSSHRELAVHSPRRKTAASLDGPRIAAFLRVFVQVRCVRRVQLFMNSTMLSWSYGVSYLSTSCFPSVPFPTARWRMDSFWSFSTQANGWKGPTTVHLRCKSGRFGCPITCYSYQVMLSCWRHNPAQRPSFTELCATLWAFSSVQPTTTAM